jgi:hypothetical protein
VDGNPCAVKLDGSAIRDRRWRGRQGQGRAGRIKVGPVRQFSSIGRHGSSQIKSRRRACPQRAKGLPTISFSGEACLVPASRSRVQCTEPRMQSHRGCLLLTGNKTIKRSRQSVYGISDLSPQVRHFSARWGARLAVSNRGPEFPSWPSFVFHRIQLYEP